MLKEAFKHFSKKVSLIVVLMIGTLSWSLTMVKSGAVYPYGMGFWGPNGHDGIWHLAIGESLKKSSLTMPIFAGEQIKNYHIGFDLVSALISTLTRLPLSVIYFQVLPVMMAFAIGLLTFHLVKAWKDEASALWATIFVYFSGSLGWIVTYFRDGQINGESVFWSQQALSTLVNPPFALSLVILLSGLIVLTNLLESPKNSLWRWTLAIILFGILIQIKAYAGVLAISGLWIAGGYTWIRGRDKRLLIIALLASLISVILFLPTNAGSTGLLVFEPFWFLRNLVSSPDRFGWPRAYSALVNYQLSGNYFKGSLLYLLVFVIFIVGNLGIRVISVVEIVRAIRKDGALPWFGVFVLWVASLGVILPMFFVQKGTAWNTIQFFYYTSFIASAVTGVLVSGLMKRAKGLARVFVVVGISALMLISLYSTLRHYLPSQPPAYLSNAEIEALSFLRRQPDGVVLTVPFNPNYKRGLSAPIPLYAYETSAYVSAFSGKTTFLEDEINLDITSYDWRKRKDESEHFFRSNNIINQISFLTKNEIKYLYLVKSVTPNLEMFAPSVTSNIFENQEVIIFEIRYDPELMEMVIK